ncbi:hypothetical protein DL240_18975 [Lujinxingia litoralis]|uniref:Peptidase M19 n=2 Tax=Lujinxingia litoralis TaxID=2211119 RepID=A0A328C2Q1_9DELT|nr:hypothetical protein DL240_18975 [Lujinxingia litoralis]
MLLTLTLAPGCTHEADQQPVAREAAPEHQGIYSFPNACVTLDAAAAGTGRASFLRVSDEGEGFAFGATADAAAPLTMRATDLGTYLFYDSHEHYLVVEERALRRRDTINSDAFTLDDTTLPGVQWALEVSDEDPTRFQLRHLKTGAYLTPTGLSDEAAGAAVITLYPAQGCAPYPELTLDAEGELPPTRFDDGSVYGFVDTHSHLFSNRGFGGAGIFHGAPFHPFGVPHALPSCEMFHGEEGRKDLFGYGFDKSDTVSELDMITAFVNGRVPEFYHHTQGWPSFTDWPSAHFLSTHQTQYYLWLKRAYYAGLRLVVNHATSNQIICELVAGSGAQPVRYSCNDMVAVDRTLEDTRALERYIDAQSGGPGTGWFRIVESPQEARAVIEEGKLAVVLGIEVSNLFDCFLVPPGGGERCTEAQVLANLERYRALGVRAIFPVHKFDNAFSAGDGHREIIELANFAMTGHYSNFTDDCPDIPSAFDKGDVAFAELNQPREDYLAEPPVDMSGFADDPIDVLLGQARYLMGGSLHGDYCQNAGLTELGEFLLIELMKEGFILEIDHLPRRSYQRAFELLVEHDYPAAGTHGNNMRGELYGLGGISKMNLGRCSNPQSPGTLADGLQERVALIESHGGYPAEGFGFDLNGFAGAPGPRFGEHSVCDTPQENPITYPFTSYDGHVTFTRPRLGEREVDFNTEGMVHLGLVAELIEDVRNDGVSDAQLEPLFRSAEAYLRFWERSEARGAALRGE